jgi:SM-20-related protein
MLVQANTGRAQSARQDSAQTIIRGDQIAWLHAGASLACDAYLQIMDQVRVLLNQSLYLGLVDFESHFSFYAPGTFYRPHVDRFHHDDTRMISIVLYLNDDWLSEQGGALRLHPKSLPSLDIAPIACRLVVFLSAEMLHEVMPATRERMSLTGWFRRRQLI